MLCKGTSIRVIPAVELDCLHHGVNIHILGYGVDLQDPAFVTFVQRERELLDLVSVKLIGKMSLALPSISIADFEHFTYNTRLGGWKALHYFVRKGLSRNLREGMRFYNEYGCSYLSVDFPSVQEVCCAVKAASGFAVLAHPGEVIGSSNIPRFTEEIQKLTELGIEGVECYYPTHSDDVTEVCIDICKEKGLLVTAGSDCHGGFGKTNVGEMKIGIDRLTLKGLI